MLRTILPFLLISTAAHTPRYGTEPDASAGDGAGATVPPATQGGTDGKDKVADADKPRMFSQEEVDRMTADARRSGRDSGRKEAAKQNEALFGKVKEDLMAEFAKLHPAAAQTGKDTGEDKSKDKPTGDKAAGGSGATGAGGASASAGDDPIAKLKSELQAEFSLKLKAQQDAQQEEIKAERAARIKLEKERDLETQSRKEAQAQTRKSEVIAQVSKLLIAEGIPAAQSTGLAQIMITEGKVTYTDRAVLYVTDEEDLNSDDGSKVKLPIADGLKRWGKTPNADEWRPAVKQGSGETGGAGGVKRSEVKFEDLSEVEKWKAAQQQTEHIFAKERAQYNAGRAQG